MAVIDLIRMEVMKSNASHLGNQGERYWIVGSFMRVSHIIKLDIYY